MIAYPVLDFNSLTQISYDSFIHSISLDSISCPFCNSHSFIFYGHYDRSFYLPSSGELVHLHVQRIYCTACHHTHALLPCSIIPFRRYLLSHLFSFAHQGLSTSLNLFPYIDESVLRRFIHFISQWRRNHHTSLPPIPSMPWLLQFDHFPFLSHPCHFFFLPT